MPARPIRDGFHAITPYLFAEGASQLIEFISAAFGGEVIERDRKGGAAWTRFAFPTWWHYDVLRGLEYLRRAGVAPDERVAGAIDLVVSKRDGDGRWSLETQYPGKMPVETDEGEGRPSRWNTLRALRVLNWYSAGD
jgi:hypothetical protein